MVRLGRAAACGAALWSFAHTARAQVSADVVYEDIRDTIHDVLEHEVARSLARQITCHSSRGLLVHYRETLDSVYYKRFESLADSFRGESARLLGAYAYSMVLDRHASLIDLVPFTWDGGYSVPDLSLTREEDERRRARTAREDLPKLSCLDQLQVYELSPSDYLRRLAPPLPPAKVALDACRAGVVPHRPPELLACEVGLAVEAAASNRLDEARRRLVRAGVVPLAWYVATDDDFRSVWESLSKLALTGLEGEMGASTLVEAGTALRVPFPTGTLDTPLVEVLSNAAWSREQRTWLGAASLALHPEALRITGGGTWFDTSECAEAAVTASSAEEFLRKLSLSAGLDPNAALMVSKLNADGTLSLTSLGRDGPVMGPGLLELESLWKVLRRASSLKAEVPLRLLPNGSFADGAALVRLLRALREVSRSVEEWREATKWKDSAVGLIHPLASTLKRAEALQCGAREAAPCDLLKQMSLLSRDEMFQQVFDAAASGDGSKAALLGIDGVFAAAKAWVDGHDHELERLQALSTSVMAYAMTERGDDDGASAATREAFKAAAFDWLTSGESSAGYVNGKPFNSQWLTLSSGVSWSNGYINRDRDGMRLQVSAEALMVQFAPVRKRNAYFGLSVSAFNLLGPLSEIALRDPDKNYAREDVLWRNFFQPRLDVSFGVPTLSRRFLLYTGVSFRPESAYTTKAVDDEGNEISVDAVYAGTSGYDDRIDVNQGDFAFTLDRLEFGVGVRLFPF